jgi:23S rRNA pseudouridine1911/1915/1917 synthase
MPRIVRSDSAFLVVDKPAGWLVHPTRPDGTFTLIDWLREQLPGEFLSLVSRLDRETSGLLLVARGKENASLLGKMQQRREILKTYLAIVHGRPPESGVIDQPLDRLGKHQPSRIYIRQAVVPGTYPAVTEFKTLATRTHPDHGEISLVEASPKTGRLHQIRAHFDHLGFPVVNDKIYGKEDDYFINYIDKVHQNKKYTGRHCLHSSKLIFALVSGSEVEKIGVRGRNFGGQRSQMLGSEVVSAEIGLPADLEKLWEEAKGHLNPI